MSTEINVRVDRELLLQRDRVQRQAQRQFVLEKNGQKLVANRSQELVAQSGAAGGENRIRSVRTSTGASTQAMPITPVTAPYQRQPLPQLGGAAAPASSDGWLALPKPYTTLPFTEDGKTVEGYAITTASAKYKPMYAADVADQSSPLSSDQPFIVDSGSWIVKTRPNFGAEAGYDDSFINFARQAQLDSKNQPALQLQKQEFTFEAILRPGKLKKTEGVANRLATFVYCPFCSFAVDLNEDGGGHVASYGERLPSIQREIVVATHNTPGIGSPLNLWVGEYYDSPDVDGNDPALSVAINKLPASVFEEFIHIAATLKDGRFCVYYNGSKVAEAPTSTFGWSGPVVPADVSFQFYPYYATEYSVEGQLYSLVSVYYYEDYGPNISAALPLLPPAVKCIRFTANKALYTGSSFTPPTSITRLA